MKVQCCVCKRIRRKKRWVSAKEGEFADQDISHGYCPKCAAEAFKQVRQLACSGIDR